MERPAENHFLSNEGVTHLLPIEQQELDKVVSRVSSLNRNTSQEQTCPPSQSKK
jgi:hypothetical protein